jgi:large subunit ribosomal protein L21
MCGGKQYCVTQGDVVAVERLYLQVSEHCDLPVLFLHPSDGKSVAGAPIVPGVVAVAKVLWHSKSDKVVVFKKKRRHMYRRKWGHEQPLTALQICGISRSNDKEEMTDGNEEGRRKFSEW